MLRFALCSALCVSACGHSSGASAPVLPPEQNTTHPAHADPRPFTVTCAEGDLCPPHVGMLTSWRGDYHERCSGTLIGPRLFLTAGHCVSPDMRRAGAPCPNHRIYFAPSGELQASVHRCVQILEIEVPPQGELLSNDYAILELEAPASRPVAVPDPRLPEPGSTVRVSGIATIEGSDVAHRLLTQSCLVTDSSRATAALGPAAARMGWLERCYIHPGHSGAPAHDEEGRVRAFVHAGGDPFFALGVMNPLPDLQSSSGGSAPEPASSAPPEPKASSNPL